VVILNSPALRFQIIIAGIGRFTQTAISQSSGLRDAMSILAILLRYVITVDESRQH